MTKMARAIRITAGSVSAEARLNDSKTAGAIWDALPIEAKGQTWGDEIYFDIGLTAGPESPREVVDLGGPRLLASRPRVLHLLRSHTGEPWRRVPRGERGQCRGQAAGGPHRVQEGAIGSARDDRTTVTGHHFWRTQ
jgi:Cyclophilin-like